MQDEQELDPAFQQIFREWPELRALGESKQPNVERLRDFIDYMIADAAIGGQMCREKGDTMGARGANGQQNALMFLRVAVFGCYPNEKRLQYMGDVVQKGETP